MLNRLIFLIKKNNTNQDMMTPEQIVEEISNAIIFEDQYFIVINKKNGEIVQKDKTDTVSLAEKIKIYLKSKSQDQTEPYVGISHRVDRPVSGAVLFAKTPQALVKLNDIIKARKINKHYWAIVGKKPEPESGRLVHFLVKNEKMNKSFVSTEENKDADFAKLFYKVIAGSDNYFLLEIELHTGRHHQIRAQLAAIECPIKGDLKYGFKRSNKDGSISLHAKKISFIHPYTKKMVNIEAPAPNDNLWKAMMDLIKK